MSRLDRQLLIALALGPGLSTAAAALGATGVWPDARFGLGPMAPGAPPAALETAR